MSANAIAGVRLYVRVGNLEVRRCPRLELVSRRHAPVAKAEIHAPDPDGTLRSQVADGATVTVEYGYRGGQSATWTGTVQGMRRVSRDQLCLLADGPDLALVRTTVRECYADESARAIARHLLQHTSLAVATAPGITIPDEPLARFPVANIPVWQAVRQLLHTLARSFGHDMRATALWLGTENGQPALFLGDFDEPGDVPVIATGENLIRHLPAASGTGLNSVETFLLPGLTHSRAVHLVDTRQGLDAQIRALTVRHEIEEQRMRTFIEYGREHGN
jgi:hypothetical protein